MRTRHRTAAMMSLCACCMAFATGCGGGSRPSGDAGTDAGRDTGPSCTPTSSQEQQCGNERDDDCDGYLDCDDVDCAASAECMTACVPAPEDSASACANGLDDDCDGQTDCADEECLAPGLATCLGTPWDSRCMGAVPGAGTLITGGVELLLTTSGVSGTAAHGPSGMSVSILTRGAVASATPVDLVAPPNDDRDTCTHCFVLHRAGKDFFVRRATATLSVMPTQLGEPFSALLRGTFEEVTIDGDHVTPVRGGECVVLDWTVTGTVVNTTATSGIAGAGVALTAGTQMRMGQGSGPYECEGTQSLDDDGSYACTCTLAEKVLCPGGHACPAGSACLTQGRCECDEGYYPLECATGEMCGTGTTGCGEGSAWSCILLGCGWTNYTVPCGNGTYCPTNSRCNAGVCECDPGFELQPCDPEGDTPELGMCLRERIPGCDELTDETTGCNVSGFYCEANSTCGQSFDCPCNAGYVEATCDGIRCSDENECPRNVWRNGCLPNAQVP